MRSYLSVLKIVLQGKSSSKILLATILSFTFSITVILCTFGLMDGFDYLLKSGLRHSSGDILLSNRKGFFYLDNEFEQKINKIKPSFVAPVIQTEAFAIKGENSRGVLVRGVDSNSFSKATGLQVLVDKGKAVVGQELAKQLDLKVGDSLAVIFGKGNEAASSLPMIQNFIISDIVKHGIYQKDLRFLYLQRSEIGNILNLENKINLLIIAQNNSSVVKVDFKSLQKSIFLLKELFSSDFLIKPFWDEYDFLIEAVKIEKFSISLVLQLIVIVAVFNIIAFVIYVMEKKSQEFFFLRAVGMPIVALGKFWLLSIISIWLLSCAGAFFLSQIFNWSLSYLPVFQIPGEIYVLSGLKLKLSFSAYFIVYGISLLWILIATLIGYLRLRRRPIIQGLRQEFSS